MPVYVMRLGRHAVISLLAAGPVGGFLFGFFCVRDPDPNPVGRIAISFVMAVLTPLHRGFPPESDRSDSPVLNAWPFIAIAAAIILAGLVYRDARQSRSALKSAVAPRKENP
jgi:hypothetical protein